MTHTNVQIPARFPNIEGQLHLVKQEAERRFWQETAEYLIRELENIPSAVAKHGHITLPDGTKLVPSPPPPTSGHSGDRT